MQVEDQELVIILKKNFRQNWLKLIVHSLSRIIKVKIYKVTNLSKKIWRIIKFDFYDDYAGRISLKLSPDI